LSWYKRKNQRKNQGCISYATALR